MIRRNSIIALVFVALFTLVTSASAQSNRVVMVSHIKPTNGATATPECKAAAHAFMTYADKFPRPTNWTFNIVCDDKTWDDIIRESGAATHTSAGAGFEKHIQYCGATYLNARVTYIRGWALTHPTEQTPAPAYIVGDALGRVILNTTDDAAVSKQAMTWIKERNIKLIATK